MTADQKRRLQEAAEDCCLPSSLKIERILAILAEPTAPAQALTDAQIEDFLAARMDEKGRVPMIRTIRDALATFSDSLKDPAVVHAAMLRGQIAKITMLQCAHTHGEEALREYRRLTENQS